MGSTKKAACLGHHDIVDRASLVRADRRASQQLRKLCQACPIVNACLQDAVETGDWRTARAGMTKRQLHAYVTRERRRRGLPTLDLYSHY